MVMKPFIHILLVRPLATIMGIMQNGLLSVLPLSWLVSLQLLLKAFDASTTYFVRTLFRMHCLEEKTLKSFLFQLFLLKKYIIKFICYFLFNSYLYFSIYFVVLYFSSNFTDEEGEFVFGPLCANRFYEIEIWVDRVKHCKICTKVEHSNDCLKGIKMDCKKDFDKPCHQDDCQCEDKCKKCDKNDDKCEDKCDKKPEKPCRPCGPFGRY